MEEENKDGRKGVGSVGGKGEEEAEGGSGRGGMNKGETETGQSEEE